MLHWNAHAKIVPVAQEYHDYCGAACIQMILEGMGLKGLDPSAQNTFDRSIDIFKGPVTIGNAVGVACTINRYNSGESADLQNPSPPSKEYRTLRSETPYDACALIVNSLKEFESAAAVQVLGGSHWVVVNGADGDGDPMAGDYTIDTLSLCNPDNGLFDGLPQKPNPKPAKIGFTLETYTYASFIVTYFTGSYYEALVCQEHCDGRKFIIVADGRARTKGKLALPKPELLPATLPEPPASIIKMLSRKKPHDWILTADPRSPLLVKRLDRPDEYYYLVPFTLQEGGVNIVRLDASGNYLGTCFAPNADAALFDDEMPLGIRRAAAELNLDLEEGAVYVQDMLVWHPSAESASPYRPFRVFSDGGRPVYASLEGVVSPQLHSLGTNTVLELSGLSPTAERYSS